MSPPQSPRRSSAGWVVRSRCRLPRRKTISPEAYETYLKANYYLDQFDLQKSIDYYDQSIKLDPNYAPAYAHMARSYFFLGFFSAIPPQQAWAK